MNSLVIAIICFLSLIHSYEDSKALITKNYILVPTTAPESFCQVSTDFKQQKFIGRSSVDRTINVVKVKHDRWFIQIYWFVDQSHGSFSVTKSSRSMRQTVTYDDAAPKDSIIRDLDIHPTLDLVYLATSGGLIEFNIHSKTYKQLKSGSYKALQLDARKNHLYYLDCSDSTKPLLGKWDMTQKALSGTYKLDKCYNMFQVDFSTEDIYLVSNKVLYRTTLSNLLSPGSWKLIKTFDKSISSIALGSTYLYLVLDAGDAIYYISRVDDVIKTHGKLRYLFSVAVYEGPELEPEPETTTMTTVTIQQDVTTTATTTSSTTKATDGKVDERNKPPKPQSKVPSSSPDGLNASLGMFLFAVTCALSIATFT